MGRAVGAAELGSVGLARAWLDLSGGGKTKRERLRFGPAKSPPAVSASSAMDLWAACCLAALDWGLRGAETLARLCMTEDSHSQYHIRSPNLRKGC